jgi:two-component system chemotaxis response regulator CheB
MKPRVLVVDDSAFARAVLTRVLDASGKVAIAGTARDGRDALAKIAELDPDVVTLDLTMPEMDGLAVLRALANRPRPRVIVVSISTIENEIGAESLALGAVDLISKPTAYADERLAEIGDELVAKVTAIAATLAGEGAAVAMPAPAARPAVAAVDLVMVGTSTGGPQALTQLLARLPANLAAPVAMTLHIPAGYTGPLAQRLNAASPLEVLEAEDGMELVRGRAVLARGGLHLQIERVGAKLVCRLSTQPVRQFTPSVDELLRTGAEATGGRALGVILTGMGDDGLAGARALHAAGGELLSEAASSCVVYGMPRCVYEAGLSTACVPLDRMAAEIAKRV